MESDNLKLWRIKGLGVSGTSISSLTSDSKQLVCAVISSPAVIAGITCLFDLRSEVEHLKSDMLFFELF